MARTCEIKLLCSQYHMQYNRSSLLVPGSSDPGVGYCSFNSSMDDKEW